MKTRSSKISLHSKEVSSIWLLHFYKMGNLFWLYYLSGILLISSLTGCSQQQTPKIITFTPIGTNEVQLEKVAENQNWRVVIHWTRHRDSLPSFTETFQPKSGNYYLVAYVTFARNPAFQKGEGVIKLNYRTGNNSYIIHESGAGNNEVFGDFQLSLLVEPNPSDPNDRPYNTELYFEVPKAAQDFQLSFGSTSPVSLGN